VGYGSGGYGSQGQGYGAYGATGYGAQYSEGYGSLGYGEPTYGGSSRGYAGPGASYAPPGYGAQGAGAAQHHGGQWSGYGALGTFGGERRESRRQDRVRREPRGYQRSDERLRDEIYDKLIRQTNIDVSDVEVAIDEGVVSLSGMLSTRWEKHQVEDIVDSIWGVKDIHNNLRVRSAGDHEGSADSGAGDGGGAGNR
jgi:hypothetical protein